MERGGEGKEEAIGLIAFGVWITFGMVGASSWNPKRRWMVSSSPPDPHHLFFVRHPHPSIMAEKEVKLDPPEGCKPIFIQVSKGRRYLYQDFAWYNALTPILLLNGTDEEHGKAWAQDGEYADDILVPCSTG